MQYKNGNALINIESNGTREIRFDDKLKLDFPLNIDIRVSTRCAFGLNPKTGKSFCSFCHESAKTDGEECDFEKLKAKLAGLPIGIELAVGSNELTPRLFHFLHWAKGEGYIVNLTVNQGHLERDRNSLNLGVSSNIIKGLGVSFRPTLKWDIPQWILEYPNTIFHVIAGIDSFKSVMELADKGVKKILILGEKDFGFNSGKVNLLQHEHRRWFWYVSKLFSMFDVVSFDNLALEQLKVRRFFGDDAWNVLNQGEHSCYLNSVEGYYAPSSRSNERTDWDSMSIKEYFKMIEK